MDLLAGGRLWLSPDPTEALALDMKQTALKSDAGPNGLQRSHDESMSVDGNRP